MKETNEVKVGAVALGGLAVFISIITFLGVFSFAGKGYQLTVSYDYVNGLKEGHVVRYAGVDIGTVKAVIIDGNKVKAILKIKADQKIPQGSQFSIGADGMLGEKYVAINPPLVATQEVLTPDSELQGVPGQGLDEFMAASSKVLGKVESIAEAFNNVFGDKEVQKSMKDGLINMRDISVNMNTFTRIMAESAVENQADINLMVAQLASMAQRMNNVAAHLDSILAGADEDGKTGRNVASLARNLAIASERVEKMTGVLSKVVTDPQTEEDLRSTLTNAKEASQKANKLLGVLDGAQFQADALYGNKADHWQTNMGVTLKPTTDTFVYMGAYDLGTENKIDFQVGKTMQDAALRVGAMQGEFGVGLDWQVGKSVKLFADLYDFNDTKVKVGGEIKLNDNFALIGQSLDVRKSGSEQTYVGVRTYF
ncbi:MAG: MlaD family protein [Acidaminococcaceae bacterium]